MHSLNFTIPARNIRSSRRTRPSLFPAAITAARWLARKINERRNLNALMELSDEQLKDIGLSRGQTESDVHVYSRY
ncbi:DUF1127 domain-containing protein [Rhizobium leguminosarum]|uniref:YjiS-like domain-containing protein n=1 Tax=Rhizobium johnstonii (strain DSM 114642 / LMG 32736 / 3841) TaxID=216596 RepID=Q1MJ74_RHIJ3|nr:MULTISPECIES: DUF1127 domain-containing protein [Rhizobium]NEI92916.1 DUF1127 domain-containing protein [Rhizobium leguminosarum]NEJ82301.1 DUF1127 domain-containing protein [Rhizobium leguminosarum]TBF39626.1 DUF1127 domain-containing protein [Rhizobium leguminosarum]TBF51329.1 DUF1127 domain-containing protein [Rhizobium leguminosarum]TBF55997.1 DUF1127 domain-containing protein [Rhizobium leguminosarum]